MDENIRPGSPSPWRIEGGAIKDGLGQLVCMWQLPGRDPQPWHRMDADFIVAARNEATEPPDTSNSPSIARNGDIDSDPVGTTTDQGTAVAELARRASAARATSWRAANTATLGLYWRVGRTVVDLIASRTDVPADEVLARVADDLRGALPGMMFLSADEVRLMSHFSQAWPAGVSSEPVWSLPWGYVRVLLEGTDSQWVRDWAARWALDHGPTREELVRQVAIAAGIRPDDSTGATTGTASDRKSAEALPAPPSEVLDRAVLRLFADVQSGGADPYDAGEDVAAELQLSEEAFEEAVGRLVTSGFVTGGRTFASAFVDTVTEKGLTVAASLDRRGRPLVTIRADVDDLSSAGFSTVHVPHDAHVRPGQVVAVVDGRRDGCEAEVLYVSGEVAQLHLLRELAEHARSPSGQSLRSDSMHNGR